MLYNTVESDQILAGAGENAPELLDDGKVRLVAVGTLKETKGYMRLLSIIKRLQDGAYPMHLYILGIGPLQQEMERFLQNNELQDTRRIPTSTAPSATCLSAPAMPRAFPPLQPRR